MRHWRDSVNHIRSARDSATCHTLQPDASHPADNATLTRRFDELETVLIRNHRTAFRAARRLQMDLTNELEVVHEREMETLNQEVVALTERHAAESERLDNTIQVTRDTMEDIRGMLRERMESLQNARQL